MPLVRATPDPDPRDAVELGLEARISALETVLRNPVKQIGGIWRPRQRLWELTYARVCALGLQGRIGTGD